MKLYITITKRRLFVILAGIVIVLIGVCQFANEKSKLIDGSSHIARERYIDNLGYKIDPKDITYKNITIPQEFDSVYENYNQLQKQSGFDLKKFKGENAVIYTYQLESNPQMQIHLIVHNNKIIGGDIASVKLNGEMQPLAKNR